MDQPVISIIVPVYNVESYLRQCLDSILMQDFNDYELLLIDDGSPDNCGNICDGYASKDPRIRVIHQENGGLSAARNTGLDNSASEYIAMVDSDDILLSTRYLSTLLDVCNDTGADISVCEHITFKNADYLPELLYPAGITNEAVPCSIIDGIKYNGRHSLLDQTTFNISPGKLYRKTLFENVRYPTGRLFEDIAVQHRLTLHCSRIAVINAALYGYRTRNDGLSLGSPLDTRINDLIFAFHDRMDYFEREGYPDLVKKAEQDLLIHLRHLLAQKTIR